MILGDHRVAHEADALDLDLDLVARRERDLRLAEDADAGGRAGQDQVAGLEREDARGVRDEVRDAEDELARPRVLQRLPVQPWTTRTSAASPTSATGTIGVETGQKVSKLLPRSHWPSANWRFRALTSFAQT